MQSKRYRLITAAGLALILGLAATGSALADDSARRAAYKSHGGKVHAGQLHYRKAGHHRYVPRARHYSRGHYRARPGHYRRAHLRRYYGHPVRYYGPRYPYYRHSGYYHRHHRDINVGAVVAGLVLGGLVYEIIDDDSSDDYSDDDSWSDDEYHDD